MAQNPYPRGWFVVAYSGELPPGTVKPMKYFGQELVIWRGESGEVHVLDAFCPHLGAHLGYGGTVRGEDVRCPFHAWEFSGAGACSRIPYSETIPKKARIKPWRVLDRMGMIFLWHGHAADDAPDWEPPCIEEFGDPAWTAWDADRITVKTQPREIVENLADSAHFPVVHGTHVDSFENEYQGHIGIQRTAGIAYPRGGGKDRFSLTATYHGPGVQISVMKGYLESRLLLAHTPVDEEYLDLRFGVSLKIVGDAERTAGFAKQYIDNLRLGFHEDIALWENKRWRDRPTICEGDGPIGRLRTWYRQFYA